MLKIMLKYDLLKQLTVSEVGVTDGQTDEWLGVDGWNYISSDQRLPISSEGARDCLHRTIGKGGGLKRQG
jgi:hypothetical protein